MLEKVLLMLSMLVMKVPSPKCCRWFIEVIGVSDEVPSLECWRGFIEFAEVNDKGSFSRMLERVR